VWRGECVISTHHKKHNTNVKVTIDRGPVLICNDIIISVFQMKLNPGGACRVIHPPFSNTIKGQKHNHCNVGLDFTLSQKHRRVWGFVLVDEAVPVYDTGSFQEADQLLEAGWL